jgi:hypothetical protein
MKLSFSQTIAFIVFVFWMHCIKISSDHTKFGPERALPFAGRIGRPIIFSSFSSSKLATFQWCKGSVKDSAWDLSYSKQVGLDFEWPDLEAVLIKSQFMSVLGAVFREHKLKLNSKTASVFHGAAIWFDEINAFVMVRRCVFGRHPWSFLAACFILQVYSRDWREVVGNISIPFLEGERQITENFAFPYVLTVARDWITDPRPYIWRNRNGFSELVIIYPKYDGRRIVTNLIFPFSRRHLALRLGNYNLPWREKNWVLLDANATHLELVTSLDSFRVAVCDIESGACAITSGSRTARPIGELRGGTHFVRFPIFDPVIDCVYVGWARAHLKSCFSRKIERFYRPNLVIIVKERKGLIRIAAVSSFFDFNASLPRWPMSLLKGDCYDSLSVLLPCSIPVWDIATDSMIVTLSASDTSVTVVEVHGVAAIVRHILSRVEMSIQWDQQAVVAAAMRSSRDFCERFVLREWGGCSELRVKN